MRFRRRRYLIDTLQLHLLIQAWVYILVALLAAALIVFAPLVIELRQLELGSGDPNGVALRFLELHRTFWPTIAVVFIAAGMHSIVVSHRIAGPLYRLRVTLEAIADGKSVRPVKLRTNDFLQREAAVLNRIIEGLPAIDARRSTAAAESAEETCPEPQAVE